MCLCPTSRQATGRIYLHHTNHQLRMMKVPRNLLRTYKIAFRQSYNIARSMCITNIYTTYNLKIKAAKAHLGKKYRHVYVVLPNASRIVFASRICCCTQVEMLAVTEQRYSRMNLVVSVFPAPDSPEMTSDWLTISSWRFLYEASARAKTWGGFEPSFCSWYWKTTF